MRRKLRTGSCKFETEKPDSILNENEIFDESNQTQLLESGEKTQVANNYILT